MVIKPKVCVGGLYRPVKEFTLDEPIISASLKYLVSIYQAVNGLQTLDS